MIASQKNASVEPCPGKHRRHIRGGVHVGGGRERPGVRESGQLFRIPLLHHAEAPKLPLLAIEIAVVVSIASDKAVAADPIMGLDALHHVYWKRQPGNPRLAVALVLQVEPGGWGVLDDGF